MNKTESTGAGRLLRDPIFIIGCNRSGTTVLFQTIASHPDLWSRYIENRDTFLSVFPHDGPRGDLVEEATSDAGRRLERLLYQNAKNRELAVGIPVLQHLPLTLFQKPVTDLFKSAPLRIVDKTPSNCFRVRMLADMFPRARFVYIVRRGEAVVSSLMEGWKHWTDLDGGWEYVDWHYLRPPGWQAYQSEALEDICAFQFVSSNSHAVNDLRELPSSRYIVVRHEDLVTSPRDGYARIREFLELAPSAHWSDVVDDVNERIWTRGGSQPEPGKWRRLHGDEVGRVRPKLRPINELFYDGDEHLDTT